MSATTIAVAVKPDTFATDFAVEIGLVMRAFVSALRYYRTPQAAIQHVFRFVPAQK
jgi:hypothetical protein